MAHVDRFETCLKPSDAVLQLNFSWSTPAARFDASRSHKGQSLVKERQRVSRFGGGIRACHGKRVGRGYGCQAIPNLRHVDCVVAQGFESCVIENDIPQAS